MNTYIKLSFLALAAMFTSCGDSFLDLQQEKNQRVPNTMEDFQKLLYQTNVMNESAPVGLANIGADEYWVTDAQWASTTGFQPVQFQKNAYVWADEIYVGGETLTGWDNAYSAIYRTNLGLEFVAKTPRTAENGVAWDQLKSSALFMRALNFYQLAQVFCPVYSTENSNLPYGLPLREETDPTVGVPRSTVGETYEKIIADINEALPLLPNKGENVYRPSKAAAYALLSRVYMDMGDYTLAEKAADDCLAIQSELLDYTTVPVKQTTLMTFAANGVGNPEIIYMNSSALTSFLNWYHPDTTLVRSYGVGDARTKLFFQDTTVTKVKDLTIFKGNYKGTNNATTFTGFATDEIYLNRAESRARNQNLTGALSDLNSLRQKRFFSENFVPLESANSEEVLSWILEERRKELILRGTRWSDLRRLNKEAKYAKTLVRVVGGERYELKPESNKWTWPIMLEAVLMGDYVQNPR